MAGVRYVFGIDPSIGPADLAGPLIDIAFDAGGRPETFFRLRNGRRYGIIKAVAAVRRRKENQ